MKSPPRGEVWLVDLGMTAKVRPALVISVPVADEDRALVTLVPHTTNKKCKRYTHLVPTVHREGPYRFFFYSADRNEPPRMSTSSARRTGRSSGSTRYG